MISKQEIMDLSREFSLDTRIIEKDYVLGWLLAGIAANPQLFDKWVFKGGTCLKKCYFETFRFSEDLDYTLVDRKHVDQKFLIKAFKQIAQWIDNETGVVIPEDTIRFTIYRNSNGREAIEGRVGYIGPLQRRGDPVRIKLDLTADEVLVSKPDLREVHHPYSDKPENGIKAYCYSFDELFAEKIRALSERARPRDLYDVVHLYWHITSGHRLNPVLDILGVKCAYKSIPVPTLSQLEAHPKLHEMETEWSNMLAHQLPFLPSREHFWAQLTDLFAWLQGESSKISQQSIPLSENIDSLWQPPSMGQPWNLKISLELIRYAGANHLCVALNYQGEKHLVEPYDLRRTQDGHLALIAVKHNTEEIQSYRVNYIDGIAITQTQFTPKYSIAMTPFKMEPSIN
jgi:predicted nucleotidyltransferase component of viral defense system